MAVLKCIDDAVFACGERIVTRFEVHSTLEESRSTPLPNFQRDSLVLKRGMVLYPLGTFTVDNLFLYTKLRNRLGMAVADSTLCYGTSQVLGVEFDRDDTTILWVTTQNTIFLAYTREPEEESKIAALAKLMKKRWW